MLFLKHVTACWREIIVTKIQYEKLCYLDMYRALSEHRTRKKKLGDFSQERPSVTKNIKDIQVEKNGTITSFLLF